MAEIVYSPAALADLRDIWRYIAESSVWQADRFVFRLRDKIAYLAEHNGMGRPRPELVAGLRSYPFGNYGIYYRPCEDGIEVVRLIHSARDLNRIKFSL